MKNLCRYMIYDNIYKSLFDTLIDKYIIKPQFIIYYYVKSKTS